METVTRKRAILIAMMFVALASGVLFKLYSIQIIRSEDFRIRAQDQQNKTTTEIGQRGSIYDRNGHELALNIEHHKLYVYPSRVEDIEDTARKLSPIMGLEAGEIARRIRKAGRRKVIATTLSSVQADQIRSSGVIGRGSPAFELEKLSRRSYPGGSLAAHVVGYAGWDSERQVGREGVELKLDEILQGEPITRFEARDALGKGFVLQTNPQEDPHQDVYLTIDAVLQHIVERELKQVVREQRAEAASAVLMEPATGKILAMANWPTANLESYSKYRSNSKRNRTVVDRYEPGSTFKIFTAAALLDQGLVQPGQRYYCENGDYQVRNQTFRDHKKFGTLSFREVLEHSSNIGTIKASAALDGDRFMEYVKALGFGRKTGVLLPGETNGRLPVMKTAPEVHKASLSIGYGIGVTPLQLTTAVAAVANQGILVPPTLVEGSRTPDGDWHGRPATKPRRVIKAETARTLTNLLEGVVLRGTGRAARVPGYRIAGKTGTTRKYVEGAGYDSPGGKQYFASFAGFGPVRDPQLALLVVVDNPRNKSIYGGEIAAPAFSRIMSDAFRHLRIPPDQESMVMLAPGPAGATPAAFPGGEAGQ
ncbi:MAG: penicillin-binding protein 2 [Acidobacteria bacterium]|uniref:Penicillin-binding protein 2 n=1 Tax=Candidatus Polarisedimenticola svalbardensis TaxID=2886004 RepID=A0A8J6Y271_9BACT|nr:penicillin-binding protein 2 [Candidatus Polarisedimenticola svalbardensis]